MHLGVTHNYYLTVLYGFVIYPILEPKNAVSPVASSFDFFFGDDKLLHQFIILCHGSVFSAKIGKLIYIYLSQYCRCTCIIPRGIDIQDIIRV